MVIAIFGLLMVLFLLMSGIRATAQRSFAVRTMLLCCALVQIIAAKFGVRFCRTLRALAMALQHPCEEKRRRCRQSIEWRFPCARYCRLPRPMVTGLTTAFPCGRGSPICRAVTRARLFCCWILPNPSPSATVTLDFDGLARRRGTPLTSPCRPRSRPDFRAYRQRRHSGSQHRHAHRWRYRSCVHHPKSLCPASGWYPGSSA